VERAETRLRKLEDELADASHWGDPERAGKSTRRHADAKRAVEEAYSRWEEATALTSGSET
jgi:ATP-binding cassette, subfamily F, member 3